MNLSQYKDAKSNSDKVKLQKLSEDVFQIISPRFNQTTGMPENSEVTQFSPSGLNSEVERAKAEVERVQKVVDDLQALKDSLKDAIDISAG